MKVDEKHYEMIIQQFFKMIRSEKVTPEIAGETIATFLYSESLENAIETLNHALFTTLKQHRNKQSWDDREAAIDKDPHFRLQINKDGLVTKVGDPVFVPDDIEF